MLVLHPELRLTLTHAGTPPEFVNEDLSYRRGTPGGGRPARPLPCRHPTCPRLTCSLWRSGNSITAWPSRPETGAAVRASAAGPPSAASKVVDPPSLMTTLAELEEAQARAGSETVTV